jgi:hypothetical protein
MFIFVVLCHEFAHQLYRSLNILEEDENSNQWQKQSDGGFLF